MRRNRCLTLCCWFVAATTSALQAQTSSPASVPATPAGAIGAHPEWPHAKPADVDTVDRIVAALYDVISGPAGQKRDWDRFRSLFVPGGRLIPIRSPKTSPPDVLLLTPDEYVARASAGFEKNGFYERSIANRVDRFGAMVHLYSSYESRHAPSDATPFARGINSIELLKSDGRYYIVEVYWDAETPEFPIPQKYLQDAK